MVLAKVIQLLTLIAYQTAFSNLIKKTSATMSTELTNTSKLRECGGVKRLKVEISFTIIVLQI